MLCPRCYGKHVVVMNGSRIPCPECAGVGELHCCDGLREQDDCPVAAESFKPQTTNHKQKMEGSAARSSPGLV
jgi:hypothetical protein